MSKTYTLLVAGATAGQCDRIDALLAAAGCFVTFVQTTALRTAFLFESEDAPGDAAYIVRGIVEDAALNPDGVDFVAGRLTIAAGENRA